MRLRRLRGDPDRQVRIGQIQVPYGAANQSPDPAVAGFVGRPDGVPERRQAGSGASVAYRTSRPDSRPWQPG